MTLMCKIFCKPELTCGQKLQGIGAKPKTKGKITRMLKIFSGPELTYQQKSVRNLH